MNCTAITNEQIEQYVKLKIIVNGEKKIKQLGTIFGHISYSLIYSALQVFMRQCTAGSMHRVALQMYACVSVCMCVCAHCGCFLHSWKCATLFLSMCSALFLFMMMNFVYLLCGVSGPQRQLVSLFFSR